MLAGSLAPRYRTDGESTCITKPGRADIASMAGSTDDNDLRLLVVGLDAGCRPVLEPMFESDELPTLQRLFETGIAGPLESQIPPWTASAWPSLYTGKTRGNTVCTISSPSTATIGTWSTRPTSANDRSGNLSDNGLSSVVVNVPVTHPPRAFNGALIPGLTAPEDPDCPPTGSSRT